MQRWIVNGLDYRVQWVHPQTHATLGHAKLIEDGDGSRIVLVVDDSIPNDGVAHNAPPQGEPALIAQAGVTAVGNVLASRARIEFLRLARAFPYGQDPDALGLDGGGDPRASVHRQDKAGPTGGARINTGLLAQPGAFPGEADPVGPGGEQPTEAQTQAAADLMNSGDGAAWEWAKSKAMGIDPAERQAELDKDAGATADAPRDPQG